jgi:Methyltransferase domain
VSPLYRPMVRRPNNVFYTDYCSAEESRKKHSGYAHDPIMNIDFIWAPGTRLIDCVGNDTKFDWAVSSHVMEHVPNPIGWLTQVFEVLNEGATFSLLLPHKLFCYDKFRNTTDAANLIDAWIRSQEIPGPHQLFDFLSRSIEMSGPDAAATLAATNRFEDAKRHYSDADALDFVIHSWTTGNYIDAHCSAFTPESFVQTFNQIKDLKILNIEISEPIVGDDEFFVELRKLGEPAIKHPGTAKLSTSQNRTRLPDDLDQNEIDSPISKADLDHARSAFLEAVDIQNKMKLELDSSVRLKPWVPKFLSNILTTR